MIGQVKTLRHNALAVVLLALSSSGGGMPLEGTNTALRGHVPSALLQVLGQGFTGSHRGHGPKPPSPARGPRLRRREDG